MPNMIISLTVVKSMVSERITLREILDSVIKLAMGDIESQRLPGITRKEFKRKHFQMCGRDMGIKYVILLLLYVSLIFAC